MATTRVINAAEREAEQAKKAALFAHKALDAVTTRDRRTMSFAPDQERLAFEKADVAARNADAKAAAARERLAKLRAGNGSSSKLSVKQARLILATAIVNEKRARSAMERNAAAIEKANGEARRARSQLEDAEAGVEQAKTATTAAVMAKARSKLAAAQDTPQAAENIRVKLEQRAGELDRAAADAMRVKESAVDDVWRAEIGFAEEVEEVARLTERLIVKKLRLRALSFFPTATAEERRVIHEAITIPQPGMIGENEHQFAQHPILKKIAEMRAALAADATAPIERL